MTEQDLIIKGLSLGTHETSWDLSMFLYKNATSFRRDKVMARINNGELGDALQERMSLILKLHNFLTTELVSGASHITIKSYLRTFSKFIKWLESVNFAFTEDNIISGFEVWTEHLIERILKKKDLKHFTGYKNASTTAYIIARTLGIPGSKPGHNLMLNTRLSRPSKTRRNLSAQADKQNLHNTFKFGKILTKICHCLDLDTVRGPLPIKIELEAKKIITIAGNLLYPDLDVETIEHPAIKRDAVAKRQALPADASLFENNKRSNILNIRIGAEILIFLAQTGMNLSQAASLRSEDFRWKTNGEDYDVFRVYKGRRHGEAVFSCYNLYREHLQTYLQWLNATGLKEQDDRLFPFLSRGMIRSEASPTNLSSIKNLFKKHDLEYFTPSDLRKTRINWLVRHTNDLDVTAGQMGHTPDVLVQDYLRPHHQRATDEIISFHNNYTPPTLAPGPGICVGQDNPQKITSIANEAPVPDCISPEGCIFCVHHKDIMSQDYCWKLASHIRLKDLELSQYKPSKKNYTHPVCLVIDRLNLKLKAIAHSSAIREQWVNDAYGSVKAGNYHPHWSGFINLLEGMR